MIRARAISAAPRRHAAGAVAALLVAFACGGQVDTVGRGGGESGAHGSGGASHENDGGVDDVRGSGGANTADGDGGTVNGAAGSVVSAGGSVVRDSSSDVEKAAACEHLFLATHSTRCGGAGLQPDEATRELPLFRSDCVQQFSQPGNGATASALEACASAMQIADCNLVDGPPEECDFRGTLPGGAPCSASTQCKSGNCDTSQFVTPGGGIPSFECGHCADAVNVGAACPRAGCVAGSVCVTRPKGSDTSRCIGIHVGVEGDVCDEITALCANDLYCSGRSGTCTPLGALGDACGSQWPTGCVAPNYCDGVPGTCRAPGDAGADCSRGQPCAQGLGCDQSTQVCAPVQWTEPGQPCDSGVRLCRAGNCDRGFLGPPLALGTCPFIAALGEACDDTMTVCDAGAACYHGKCVGAHSVTCQ